MAEQGLAWITRDDAAKRAHLDHIRQNRLSVVWVRGIDRAKGKVTAHDVHMMLAAKLRHIAHEIASANGPVYYEVYVHGDSRQLTVVARRLDFERIRRGRDQRRRRR